MIEHIYYHRQIINKKPNPKGVLVGVFDPETGAATVGWSLCCTSDNFNKIKGRAIARNRARVGKLGFNLIDLNENFAKSLVAVQGSKNNFPYMIPHSMEASYLKLIESLTEHFNKIRNNKNVEIKQNS